MLKSLCIFALLVSVALCQSQGSQPQVLHIRFVHGVQNGPNVDIYTGSATQSNLLFGSVRALTITPYANLTTGSNNSIIVTEAGNVNNVLITASSLPASGSFTGIVQLNQGVTTAFFVNDSLAAPLSLNQSSIRFMFLGTEESFFTLDQTENQTEAQNQTQGQQGNTTSVAGAYSIQIQGGTTLILNANLFDKEFERVVLPAGTYTFNILKGNQTVGTIGNVTVVGGRAYSIIVYGSNNGQLVFQVVEDVFAFVVVVPTQSSSQTKSQTQSQTQSSQPSDTAAGGSAATTGSQTQASTVTSGVANTVVIVTGVNRPNIPSSAGSLRVDVAVFGVVCAVLFALFH